MKSRLLHLAAFLLAISASAQAQDFAPTSLSGKTAVVVVSSGSGSFASIGGYRISFATSSATYSIVPLSTTVINAAGTYVYTKTGPNTGRIAIVDSAVGAAVAQTLVFASQTTASYSLSSGFGSQIGTVVFENVVVAASAFRGFVNMSVRAQVGVGGQIIPGLVLDSPTRVLIRVAGPALSIFGIAGYLPNPKLTIMSGSAIVATNDDWSSTPSNQAAMVDAASKTGAFAYTGGSKDAGMVLDLNAGNYTCVISGEAGTGGEVILEVYRVQQ